MMDCSWSYGNSGCEGGDMNLTFFYVKDHGITTEKNYPYMTMTRKCNETKVADRVGSIKDCTEVTPNSKKALMNAIKYGPTSVAVQGNQLTFQFYRSGVFTGKCGYDLNHAILAVGYGQMRNKEGDMQYYYTVRNSWGDKWGMNGYILMDRNFDDERGKCGIHMAASYAF